jgi:hypothetical protein
MSERHPGDGREARVMEAVQIALRLVCVCLPHLSGLAHQVRIALDARSQTCAIFASGRLVVNPEWFERLDRPEAAFVIAHELLHLALHTHERGPGTDSQLFNLAHDLVINDMLAETFGRTPPAGGLYQHGARHASAESLVRELRERVDGGDSGSLRSWGPGPQPAPETALAGALRAAGLIDAPEDGGQERSGETLESDALGPEVERKWFPELDPAQERRAAQHVREAAAKAVSLALIQEELGKHFAGESGEAEGSSSILQHALKILYRPPWELALQRWMAAAAPGPRSYTRPSRRGADRTDVVLAGRRREGWTLHLVLDTSGSMCGEFPRVLGAIASFCDGANVGQVRILQCDAEVTSDRFVSAEQLQSFTIAGLGGSDMSPAMLQLAGDPEVEAAIVVTDGQIDFPQQPMPYTVLWVLTRDWKYFLPHYGQVIRMPA